MNEKLRIELYSDTKLGKEPFYAELELPATAEQIPYRRFTQDLKRSRDGLGSAFFTGAHAASINADASSARVIALSFVFFMDLPPFVCFL